jgi:molecular chaperone DnaK (HSP70)
MTRAGKYVFTANTGSGTISRLVGTGDNVFVDNPVAAHITTGGAPSDIDADQQVLGVIDHGGGHSHLSLFSYNRFGELTASGAPIDLGVANANGIAIMAPSDRDDR